MVVSRLSASPGTEGNHSATVSWPGNTEIGLLLKNRASTIATCATPYYHPKEDTLLFLGPLGARNALNKLKGGGLKFFLDPVEEKELSVTVPPPFFQYDPCCGGTLNARKWGGGLM
jgi:hypothetical protein